MLYDVREMALWKKQNYAKHRKVSIYQEFVRKGYRREEYVGNLGK